MPEPPPSLLTPDEREDYEERAAIMQYEAGLTRHEAERAALEDVLRRAEL